MRSFSGALLFITFGALAFVTARLTYITVRGRLPSVSLFKLWLVGPLVIFHPERYLTPPAADKVPGLSLTWLGLFVLLMISGAVVNAQIP